VEFFAGHLLFFSVDNYSEEFLGENNEKQLQLLYIVSVSGVQFFYLLIGQNRITCRSTKRHVRQPIQNETFIDRSTIEWVQCACLSTMKFQSSSFKLFILKTFTAFHLSSFGFKLSSLQ
jgi:hypothetical protein